METLYFDNNATTRLDPEVREEMLPFLDGLYGNPSSAYALGRVIRDAIEQARERVAALIGAEPETILFTSCGTESDNAAIFSALEHDPDRKHIVTTKVEHSAIIKHAEKLARKGFDITWLKVDSSGRLNPDDLRKAVHDETAIVTIMMANNETGVLFPVHELAAIAAEAGAFFHTDAVQAVGKIPIDVTASPIDFLSLSAHKLHAPKGVGALYIRKGVKFHNFLVGGGQESGRRGGTENVASIVAMGKAAELARLALDEELTRVTALRDGFEAELRARISNLEINGGNVERLPNTSSLTFRDIDGEALLILLDQSGVCASAGSACTTGAVTPSHVLTAMGRDVESCKNTLRFSFSRFTTEDEVDHGIEHIVRAVEKIRSLCGSGPVVQHVAHREKSAIPA